MSDFVVEILGCLIASGDLKETSYMLPLDLHFKQVDFREIGIP